MYIRVVNKSTFFTYSMRHLIFLRVLYPKGDRKNSILNDLKIIQYLEVTHRHLIFAVFFHSPANTGFSPLIVYGMTI